MSDLPAVETKSSLPEQSAGLPSRQGHSSNTQSDTTAQLPLWRLWDLFAFLIFFVASILMVQAVAWFGYGLLKSRLGWELPTELVFQNAFVVLGLQVISLLLLFGYIFLVTVVVYHRPFWASLRLRRPASRVIRLSLLAGLGLAFAVYFAPTILPDKDTFPFQELFSSPESGFAMAVFSITLAPFMEELIFRGFIFAIMEARLGIPAAVVTSAVLFGLIHVPQYWGAWNHVLLVSLVGLTLSLTRARTGSLTPSIIMHTAYNFVLFTFLYFETDGFQNLAVALGK